MKTNRIEPRQALDNSVHPLLQISALDRLNELSSHLWREHSLDGGLAQILKATIELLGADRGSIHIVRDDGPLRLFAQNGFDEEFIKCFREISPRDGSVLVRAFHSGSRIIVEDVEVDDQRNFPRGMAKEAGCRSLQSTPLVGRCGKPIGVLSTYWSTTHRPRVLECSLLDLYASQAENFIERWNVEKAMHESEARFRELVERSPFGIYVIDSCFRIIHMNSASKRGAFRNVDNVIGRHFLEAMRILWPESVALEIVSLFRKTMETGVPFCSREFVKTRADVGQVEAYEWELHRLVMADGGYGVICYYFDSTRMRETERALRESEERLRLAQQAAHIGTFEWNMQTGVNTWTPELETLHGLPIGDFGRTQAAWEKLIHPEDYEAAVRLIEESVVTGEPVQGEWRVIWPDGTVHWVGGRWQVFKDVSGRPLRMVGVNFDITDRKRAEASLAEERAKLEHLATTLLRVQEDERRRIARELHDDFTQRLAALTIDLESLGSDITGYEETIPLRLRQAAKDAKQLTRELQSMAHHLHPSILENLGLEAAVREYVDEFKSRVGLSVEVVARRCPNSLSIEKATALYRVVQESLQNIYKHANATAGLIQILKTPEGVGLCIRDDGKGFDKVEMSSQQKGLGLISMEERIQALNGSFCVRSRPTCGTEIHAWVPLNDGHESGRHRR